MPFEEFIKQVLEVFHKVQQDIDPNEFNELTKKLYETIEPKKLGKLISIDDLRWALKDDVFFCWNTTIKNVSDETFVERFRYTILTTKTYDFYAPIYCLYGIPQNTQLANSTAITFENLPVNVQEHYLRRWKFRFTINKEYHRKEDEYVNLKKSSTFLHITVEANATNKATERAKILAEDVLHTIRFVYDINFNLIDIDCWIRGTEESSGTGIEGLANLPFCGRVDYNHDVWGKSLKIITRVFNKPSPTDIDERIKRAIRIYGTQESITNIQVRFLLLMTCLESLLMTKSDRDYINWKLAEKTAFVLGGDMLQTYNYVKNAYGKRSSYIHGDSEKTLTDHDIQSAKQIVGDVIWKLLLVFKEYNMIKRDSDPKKGKSIDEYIEQVKFSAKQLNRP